MEFVTRGAVAGFAGTTAMSAAMLALKKARMEPGELEPKEVAENVEETVGIRDYLPKRAFEASWIMLHFGYGSTSGVAYAVAGGLSRLDRPALVGASFGMLLWARGRRSMPQRYARGQFRPSSGHERRLRGLPPASRHAGVTGFMS